LTPPAAAGILARVDRKEVRVASTATAAKRSFGQPDETRPFQEGMGQLEVISIGDYDVGLGTFEPGWQWSKHVKPIAGTDSCQANHTGYVVSGRMVIRMNNGDEVEVGPGDTFHLPPGHDAWVVGDEACKMFDFTGVTRYAKPT
jgi:quercetin dioxygenase-like cupin family protein